MYENGRQDFKYKFLSFSYLKREAMTSGFYFKSINAKTYLYLYILCFFVLNFSVYLSYA